MHGIDGLDEITITGKTFVAEAVGGTVTTFEIEPENFGMSRSSMSHLRGGDAAENAEIIRAVLSGERRDEARSLVIMNAAAALRVGGMTENLRSAVPLAAQSIDSGAAASKLNRLIQTTNT